MATHDPRPVAPPDVLTLLSQLSADDIAARLERVEAERAALLALQRTLRARERADLRRREAPCAR
jgi:hypothetical protein